jgi:hypothetical protein
VEVGTAKVSSLQESIEYDLPPKFGLGHIAVSAVFASGDGARCAAPDIITMPMCSKL